MKYGTSIWMAGLLSVFLVGTGCSPDDPSQDTGDTNGAEDDSGPTETAGPELRDVEVAIQGEFSTRLDLNDDEDVTRVLPTPAEAEITVFASDDETDSKDLTVEAVGKDGEPLSKKSEEFSNGLWTVTVDLAPGVSMRVEVTDGDGDTTASKGRLVIPTRESALVAEWERRFYDGDETITDRWNRTVSEEGSWEENRNGRMLEGSYAVQNEKLEWTVTSDSKSGAGKRRTVSTFYVDDTYFSHLEWTRDGSGSDLQGTWSRSYEVYQNKNGSWERTKSVSQTLELMPKSNGKREWKRTTTGTDYTGGSESPIDESASGTWKIIENESYSGNYGNFLRRTTTHRNGSELGSAETAVELFHMPLDKLLISPYLRSPEQG